MAKKENAVVDRAVAVVLAPPGCERDVLRKLSLARPWQVTAKTDPLAAMVEIALAHHAGKTRHSIEANGAPAKISFVIAHPEKCAARHEIIAAVMRYFPDVEIHRFDESGLHWVEAPAGAKQPQVRAKRDTPTGGLSGDPDRNAKPSEDSPTPTITREEIDMLLDGPDDAVPKKKKYGGGK